MRDFFVRVVTSRPLLWIGVLAVVTLVLAPFVRDVPFVFEITEMFTTDDPAVEPTDRFRELFGRDDNIVVVAWADPQLLTPEGMRRVERLSKAIEEFPGTENVMSLTTAKEIRGTEDGFGLVPLVDMKRPESVDFDALRKHLTTDPLWSRILISLSGDVTQLVISLEHEINSDDGRKAFFTRLDDALEKEGGDYHIGGVPVIRSGFVQYMQHDLRVFIPWTIVLCGFLTFLLYRHVRPVALMFVVIALTVIWTFGLMGLFGGSINIITIALPTLLMVMGTAYGVHFTGRYIEELALGRDRDAAVKSTVRHMLLAIFMTSVTTAVGFLSLLVMRVRLVRMFGIYSAVGMAVAFIVTILFLTAILLKLKPLSGRAVDRFGDDIFRRYLLWNDRFVRRHKILVAAVSLGLAAVSIVGITMIHVDAKLMIEMNPKSKEYIANTFLEQNLSGVLNLNLLVEAEPDAFLRPDMLRRLDRVTQKLRGRQLDNGEPAVDHAISFSELIKLMHMAMNGGDPAYRKIPEFSEAEGGEERARRLIKQYMLLYGEPDDFSGLVTTDYHAARVVYRLKDRGFRTFGPLQKELLDYARGEFGDDARVEVVGETVMAGHIVNRLVRDMTRSLVLAAFVIVIVFFLIFRSLRLGGLAMIPNLLPLLLTMATLGFFGITLRTSIVIVFSIALGIAVDDTIHFLARLRSERRAGKPLEEAITATFLGTGRSIMFTSLILCAGFALLYFSQFMPAKNFGWLSALTMVTALIGDLFLLPALLHIFKPKII
ncbi:MAG: MMPL family transporter [Candidatus Lernaella stagnicola]|nr:MMPL family transporter [Candidatus Lernaella stagnicola]